MVQSLIRIDNVRHHRMKAERVIKSSPSAKFVDSAMLQVQRALYRRRVLQAIFDFEEISKPALRPI
jgi:hypothetical protein